MAIIKKLRRNPNSRIGFQTAMVSEIDLQSLDYCERVVEDVKRSHNLTLKIKVDNCLGRYLLIQREVFNNNESVFQDFQAKKMRTNYMLIDPQMQIFNERINTLLLSVHKEL